MPSMCAAGGGDEVAVETPSGDDDKPSLRVSTATAWAVFRLRSGFMGPLGAQRSAAVAGHATAASPESDRGGSGRLRCAGGTPRGRHAAWTGILAALFMTWRSSSSRAVETAHAASVVIRWHALIRNLRRGHFVRRVPCRAQVGMAVSPGSCTPCDHLPREFVLLRKGRLHGLAGVPDRAVRMGRGAPE